MIYIYIPYTYLIGWTTYNKWYYGVRYRKGCHPDDFFKKYFTSSKHVKKFIEQYGLPDIIQIRKTFDNKEKALLWEHKVLKRLKVTYNEKWLNKTDGSKNWYNKKGIKRTEKQIINYTIANRLKAKDENYLNKLRKPKLNKENYFISAKKRSESLQYRKNLSKALKEYNKLNPRTDEHKLKISISKKGKPNIKNRRPAVKYTCSYCNKNIGGKSNLLRYHEENCKNKI